MTFEDYYELQGMRDELISIGNGYLIETSCNIDPNLNYIKITRLKEYEKVCRLFIDKPEYFICDFYLTNEEIDILIPILKENWNKIIYTINESKKGEDLYPLVDQNLSIPDYNLLKENTEGDN